MSHNHKKALYRSLARMAPSAVGEGGAVVVGASFQAVWQPAVRDLLPDDYFHTLDIEYTGDKLTLDRTSESTPGSNHRGLCFAPDGRSFLLLSRSQSAGTGTAGYITQYKLSEPWKLSTAQIYHSVRLASMSIEMEISAGVSHGLYVDKKTGRTLFFLGRTKVWKFSLSSPWDLKTWEFEDYNDIDSELYHGDEDAPTSPETESTSAHDFYFHPDGTHLYVDHRWWNRETVLTMSTPWDISTLQRQRVVVLEPTEDMRASRFTPNGKRFFNVIANSRKVHQYSLSEPWDLSTATFDGSHNLAIDGISIIGQTGQIDFSDDGQYLFAVNTHETATSAETEAYIWKYRMVKP